MFAAVPAFADPTDMVSRPIVLDRGELLAALSIEVNLELRRVGMPTSIAPDLWFGVTSRWTIGLVHSSHSVDRIDTGSTFCVRELPTKCDRLIRGTGIDVRWRARGGALAVAPRGRLLLRDVDPMKPALTLGALARWTDGRYSITTDPYLRLGLANRDLGNRAALMIPLWFAVQPGDRWQIALHTGWESELAVWRDGWHVPFGLVVQIRATDQLELGLEAGFSSLLGPQNNIKQRVVIATVQWRGEML